MDNIAPELTAAFEILNDRCLYEASKWIAEALNGFNDDTPASAAKLPSYLEKLVGQPKSKKLILAQSYFHCHEYDRCAWVLEPCVDDPAAVFLRLYAKYLSGEKRKEEECQGILTENDTIGPNKQIASILKDLLNYPSHIQSDPFIMYLTGVVYRHQKNDKNAVEKLIGSINAFPYNWSAWQELLVCLPTVDHLAKVSNLLPYSHIMKRFFDVMSKQEFYQANPQVYHEIRALQRLFPRFAFLNVQKALLDYHSLSYDASEKEFEAILLNDPHRLDDMDIYSNILYVLERSAKLSYLAQIANTTDKFRPETCCIIANYYSLKSHHEQAILYYQRALTLDRNCLSAWTLMGHEFIERRNANAAIECYRRVVDANKTDYRAWYGLGQAYEIQDLPYYSLYYYQRAIALKPNDSRTWMALGGCYEKLRRLNEAIKAYKKALSVSDMDPFVLFTIATLYEQQHDIDNAAIYMKRCIGDDMFTMNDNNSNNSNNNNNSNANNDNVTNQDAKSIESIGHARLWLAKHEMSHGNYKLALQYAEGVMRGTATLFDEARSIIRDCKNRLRSNS